MEPASAFPIQFHKRASKRIDVLENSMNQPYWLPFVLRIYSKFVVSLIERFQIYTSPLLGPLLFILAIDVNKDRLNQTLNPRIETPNSVVKRGDEIFPQTQNQSPRL
jgi:hypothetical protein